MTVRVSVLGKAVAAGAAVLLPILAASGGVSAAGAHRPATSAVSFHFSAPPIARAGSLMGSQVVPMPLRATSAGAPAPGAVVYLVQTGGVSGDATLVPAAQCGGVSQLPPGGGGLACTTDSSGTVAMSYRAPAQPPAQGRADWQANNSGTNTAITHYQYATNYRFDHSPIATSGSLAPSATVALLLSVADGGDVGIPNSAVYASFRQAPGGGSASVGGSALTSQPVLLRADGNGQLQIVYAAPTRLPSTGQDAVVVQDSVSAVQMSQSTTYAFAAGVPTVSVGDVSAVEGDMNRVPGTAMLFTVELSSPQPTAVTLSYTTSCGVGDKGCSEDLTPVVTPLSITIDPGKTSRTIQVRAFSYVGGFVGETYVEGFFVHLFSPSGGSANGTVLGRSVGKGLILPDQENTSVPLHLLYVGSAGAMPAASGTAVVLWFPVTSLSYESTSFTFHYATSDGSAVAGADYLPATGDITIPAGTDQAEIPVALISGPTPTANRTFTLTISNTTSTGPRVAGPAGTGTVLAG